MGDDLNNSMETQLKTTDRNSALKQGRRIGLATFTGMPLGAVAGVATSLMCFDSLLYRILAMFIAVPFGSILGAFVFGFVVTSWQLGQNSRMLFAVLEQCQSGVAGFLSNHRDGHRFAIQLYLIATSIGFTVHLGPLLIPWFGLLGAYALAFLSSAILFIQNQKIYEISMGVLLFDPQDFET